VDFLDLADGFFVLNDGSGGAVLKLGVDLIAHARGDSGPGSELCDLSGFPDGVSERFFAVNVFSAAQSFLGDDGVGVIRGGYIDGVEFIAHLVEHLPEIREMRNAGPTFVDVDEVFFIDVTSGDDINFGVRANGFDVGPAAAKATDGGEAEFLRWHDVVGVEFWKNRKS